MQKKIRRLLTIAACATLLSNTGVIAFAADDETTTPTSPSIYGNLIEIKNGTMYANGIDGSTGIIYDVHDSEPYWYSGGENTLYVDGGSLIVHDYVSSSLTNGLLVATSGNVTAEKDGTLTIATNSFIRRDVNLSVIQDATLDITGGEVLFNTGDQIDGKVVVSGGLLEIDNFTRNPSTTSAFEQTGGTITITGTGMDFASDRDSITGGTVNVGQNATGGSLGVSHGYIGAGATVNIFENSSMDVKGGNVTLDAGDTYRGDVTLSSGELKLDSASKTFNATYKQTGGDAIITGTGFDLNNSEDSITGGDVYIGDGSTTGELAVTEGTIDSAANLNIGDGSSLKVKGGTVSLDSKDIINGGINVANGTINLDNAEKATTATFVQNGGTTNISGDSFVLNNTSDAINNGNLNIGNDGGSGTLTLRGGSVASETDVNIAAGSEVDIKSGSMSLDSNDTWTGNVNVQGGTLNVKNTDKTGALTQTDGTINVSGNAFDLNSSEDLLDGGTLNIGNGSVASTLTVSNGTITKNEDVYINNYSNLNITGGNVTLDSSDSWNGNVNISEGDLSLEDATKSSSGVFHQTGGDTVITGRTFDLNNKLDYIEGGNVTIGNGTSSSKLTMSEGAIASGAKVDLTKNATIEVSGGDLVLDSTDTWNGNLTVSDGTAKLDGISKNEDGIYTQTGGSVTVSGEGLDLNNSEDLINGGLLQIGNGSDTSLTLSQGTIQKGAQVNINKNAQVNVAGGNMYLNSGDTWYGDVNVTEGGYLSIDAINKNAQGTLNQTGGNVDITSSKFELNNAGDKISGGTLTVGSGSNSTILEVSEGTIEEDATVKLNSSSFITVMGNGDVTLDSGDTWNGGVEVNGGTLTLNDINSKNGVLSQLKGTTNINGTGLNLDNEDDQIVGGTLNIGDGGNQSNLTVSKGTITEDASVNLNQNSTLTVDSSGKVALGKTSTINGNIDIKGGTFSLDSLSKDPGGTFTQSGGTATIKGMGFDLNNSGDSISAGVFNVGDGTVASEVSVSKGVIQSSAVTNINSNSKLNISGGTVSLGSDDKYNGEINLSDGELNLKSVTKGEDGVLNQTGGVTTITGTSFGLDNVYDSITGGTINIGNGTVGTVVSVGGGTIAANATTNINSNATLGISGVGNVSLDKSDNLDGNINMSGGTLALDNVDKNAQGVFIQTGGSTTVTGTGFDLNNYQDSISKGSLTIGDGLKESDFTISEGTVEGDVRIDLNENSQINLAGGTLTFDSKDSWDGDINMTSGELTLDNVDEKNGVFTQKKGTTNIVGKGFDLNNAKDNISGGTVNIGNGKVSSDLTVSQGTIGGDAIVNLNELSKLKVNGGSVTFNEEGSINGDISVSSGSLTLNSIGKNSNSKLEQTGGTITVTGDDFDLNNEDDNISHGYFIVGTDTNKADMSISKGTIGKDATTIISKGSTVTVNGGNLSLDGETDTLGGNLNISSGKLELDSISKDEGSTFTQTGGDTSITGNGFSLNNPNDIISGGTVHVGGTVADSSLGIDGGTISSTAVVTVDKGSSVIMSNGTITDGATMNFNDTSKFEMSEGYITDGATVNLNNSSDFTMEKGSITNEAVVNASNSSTINIGQGVISDGAQINLDREAQMNITDAVIKTGASVTAGDTSVINMENGNITKNATVTLDDRAEFNMENGMINEGANLNLNSQSTFNLNGGEIAEDANVSLTEHATINQNNGKLSLNSSDTYSGKINLNGGNLVINGANKGQTGILNQTGGQTQILGNTFDLNNAQDKILGGSLVVGDVNNESTLTISNGTVSKDVETTIYQDSTINLNGGKLALDSADTIEGNLNVTTGRLELDGASKGEYGTFTQTGGETFVTGSGFDLNNEKDNISGGSVVVGGEVANSDLTLSEGSISSSAHVKVDNGSTINVSGGSITTGAKVDIEDTSGLTLTDGSITDSAVINFEDTSNMTMSGGEVSNGASLNFEDESSFEMTDGEIKDKAQVNITENSSMTMTKGQITSGAGVNVSNTGTFNMDGGIVSDNALVNLEHEAVMNISDGVIKSGASVTAGDTSVINMENGNITKNATVTLDDRAEFNMENGMINEGANLNLNSQSTFNLNGGEIAEDANVSLTEHATINQNNGKLSLNSSDTYSGKINLNGGNLVINGANKGQTGILNQTGGQTQILGNTFDLNNAQDKILGGSLVVGDVNNESTLTISNGTVSKDVETTIYQDSTINLNGGKLALDSADTIEGNLNVTTGRLELDGASKGEYGTFTQTGGETFVTGSGFDLNNEKDNISGGSVVVGGEVANSDLTLSEGSISSSAHVKVDNGSTINVSGGSITTGAKVDIEDTSGLTLTDGSITDSAVINFEDTSNMTMSGGEVSNGASLNFEDESSFEMTDGEIKDKAQVNITENSSMTMTKGQITSGAGLNVSNTGIFNMNGGIISDSATVNLNHEAQMNMADGVVKSGATVNVNDTSSLNMTNGNITGTAVVNLKDRGEFNMEEGTFNDGATLNIDDQGEFNISGGSFASDATMVISEHGKVNQAGGSVELDKSDTFNGIYNMTGGSLTLDEVKKAESAEFTQTGGDTLIIGNTFDLNNTSDKISGGSLTIGTADEASTLTISKGSVGADTETTLVKDSSINVTGGKLALNSTDKIQGNINLSKGQVSLDSVTKGQFGTYIQTDGTTTITGTGFTFNNENDMISGGTVIVGGEVANSEFNLAEGTISSSAAVKVNNGSAINMSGGTITDGASVKVDDTSSFNMTDGDITNEAYMEFNDSAQMNMYDGTISDSAELDFNDEAKMNMSDGTITNNAVLNFQDNAGFVMTSGEITEGAQVNLRDDATMDMTDGEINSNAVITLKDQSNFQMNSSTISDNAVVNMNNESTMAVSDGKIATGATVNMDDYSQLTINGGAITDEAKVNLNDRTSLVLSDGTISDEAVINLNDASSMNVEENGVVDETAVINIGNRATVNQNGGQMTLNSNDTYNGTINMTSGELTIKDIAKTESAVFNQTGGNTTLLDTKFTMNNDKDRVSGGSLNIGTIADPATLVIERGQVDKAASVDVEKDSAIEVNGGSLALDGATDNLAGSLTISKGTLELDSMTNKHSSGVFTQTGGTTNVKGQGFTMNNDEDVISGGIVNIGGDRPDSELAMTAGTIKGDAVINIDNNSNLDVGGTAVVTDGAEVTAKDTSSVSVTGGTITGDAKIYLTDSSELNVSDGEVTYDAYISLGEDATLNQSGGKVALSGTEDVVEGSISISDGELTLNKVEKSTDEKVTYNQTGGKVNLQDSKLALNSPSSKISGGALNLTNSSLDINNSSENSSDLTMVTSDLKLREGNEYTVTGGDIDKESTITVEKNATFAIDGEGTVVRLDGKNDVVEGNLEVAGGTLYISDDLRKVTTADGNYVQTGGNVNLDNSSLVLETEGSKIASGSMSLKNNSTLTVTGASTGVTGGALSIDDTSKLNYLAMAGMTQTTDNIRLHTSGLVDTINGVSTKNTLDSIVVNNGDDGDGQADFAIDINARATSTADTDKYIANTISVSTKDEAGVINISDFQLNGDLYSSGAPIDRHIRLGKIFDSDKIDDEITFTSTDKEIFTPIGYYKLNASSANDGSYSLDLTKFNPQAFRGQVTTAAAYFNQLSVNDSLFNKAQIRRYSPSYGDMFRNRTALIEGTATYDRTMRESEVWVEAIGNFETFKFNNSLDKVRNNSWGMIVGADFGVKRLKRGWSWVPTGYVAYTGGHQTFNGVSAYQNGAQIGFMSSWMKGNFIESALINTGIYGNDMEVSGNSEDAFGYFVGLASKTAYDIPITHYFKIQPALTLSYNMFGKQNFHSDYGNMHMTSGFLNGFNIAPNLNFIWHRENWSAYAQISYAWNLFTGLGGRAGNVELNNIKLDEGYVQYAIGMTKSFSDRLDMYAQATFRNFGRTGVVCQGGLNWRL